LQHTTLQIALIIRTFGRRTRGVPFFLHTTTSYVRRARVLSSKLRLYDLSCVITKARDTDQQQRPAFVIVNKDARQTGTFPLSLATATTTLAERNSSARLGRVRFRLRRPPAYQTLRRRSAAPPLARPRCLPRQTILPAPLDLEDNAVVVAASTRPTVLSLREGRDFQPHPRVQPPRHRLNVIYTGKATIAHVKSNASPAINVCGSLPGATLVLHLGIAC
jgi:hypothetical protein